MGAKATVNVEEPPAGKVRGSAKPEYVKVVPASDAWDTVRFAVPMFLIITDCEFVTPTETFEKLTLLGTTEI